MVVPAYWFLLRRYFLNFFTPLKISYLKIMIRMKMRAKIE